MSTKGKTSSGKPVHTSASKPTKPTSTAKKTGATVPSPSVGTTTPTLAPSSNASKIPGEPISATKIEPALLPKAKSDDIAQLLAGLSKATTIRERKRLRRELRALGHKGGLGKRKSTNA